MPTNVCHFVPATILKAGAKIEILDISKKDLCINQDQVISALKENKKKYSGIIYVRSFGVENDVTEFFTKIKTLKNDLFLVDDKCLGIPSFDKKINPLVDLELFSTGYSKYIDLGYGGFAKINDKLNYLKNPLEYSTQDESLFSEYFRNVVYKKEKVNVNKLDEIINLNWLNSEDIIDDDIYISKIKNAIKSTKENKENINKIYNEFLNKNLKIENSSNIWRYNISVIKREEVLEALAEENLFASKHYYPLSKIFESKKTPNWNLIYNKILNLFNDFRYSINQAKKTVTIINKIESK